MNKDLREFIQELYDLELSETELYEIESNLIGYFQLLNEIYSEQSLRDVTEDD